MAWQDRPYYRDRSPSAGNPLLWLFTGSFPLFTAFGIRVRAHAALLTILVVWLGFSALEGPQSLQNAIAGSACLFVVILLHEFGHCFAARWVGGEAHEILLWPLGGLAFPDVPRRPWPNLVTSAGGPLVNVLICLVIWGLSWLISFHHVQLVVNPLTHHHELPAMGKIHLYVWMYMWWLYAVSWGLLLFNLLPIFPLDGGQMLRELLWFKLGYYRATLIASVVGMVGAALMVLYGMTQLGSWSGGLLLAIGISSFLYCYQTRAQTKAAGPWEFEDEGVDYSASLWQPNERPKKHKKLSRRAVRRLRRQAQAEEQEQAQIDAILAKVSAHGMHTLTWRERRALRKATERQRRREIEVSDRR